MAESITCKLCARLFDDEDELRDHMRDAHGEKVEAGAEPAEEELAEAKQEDR